MVPIYESDVAEERWKESEWGQYELWEKVEHRLHRAKRAWVIATAIVFVILSAVPVVMDQMPKWRSLYAIQSLAREINQIKREAGMSRSAVRIRFLDPVKLDFVVESAANCLESSFAQSKMIRPGALPGGGDLELLDRARGEERGIPGLVTSFCYDPYLGEQIASQSGEAVGFAIIPAKDLAERRFDRVALLVLSGTFGEISFE